ncbi:DUF302 domain-containing protein [Marinobacter sp. HL-58]|uniref:DUF302 domain-containing protein n=1 Tax=Marinobacter sp. HL-58 TaxID=1479237 RepID=UPI0004838D07|nr:DUF302 domain-containing protein [Marinobacter sp. HL-58]KPP98504.1 MAG: hypothetical protein HLUCCO03_02250 [Marinobacter sp. HL-58]
MVSVFRGLVAVLVLALPLSAMAAEGMVEVRSSHSAGETADKLVSALEDKGMTVMNRINHAEGADKAGLDLRPTEVVIFGNPKVGTPLMQCARSVAIDLPQKALIWEDSEGNVWLAYNDPEYLKKRHNIEGCDEVIEKVKGALAGFAKAATE